MIPYWPQITLLALIFADVLASFALHGKRSRDYNAFASVFSAAIILSLLYAGGFFQ